MFPGAKVLTGEYTKVSHFVQHQQSLSQNCDHLSNLKKQTNKKSYDTCKQIVLQTRKINCCLPRAKLL